MSCLCGSRVRSYIISEQRTMKERVACVVLCARENGGEKEKAFIFERGLEGQIIIFMAA